MRKSPGHQFKFIRGLQRGRRARLSLPLIAFVLVSGSLAAPSLAATDDATKVDAYARECFARWSELAIIEGLHCLDGAAVRKLHARYVDTFVAPEYSALPDALSRGFDTHLSRQELLALKPGELIAGALRGALLDLEDRGHEVRSARFDVAKTAHRIHEVYEVVVRARIVVTHGEGTHQLDQTDTILARLVSNAVLLGVPKIIPKLLDLEADGSRSQ
jgi:hypothetical protein